MDTVNVGQALSRMLKKSLFSPAQPRRAETRVHEGRSRVASRRVKGET